MYFEACLDTVLSMLMGSFPEALFMYIFQHRSVGIKQKNLLLHSKVLNKV